MGKLLTHQIRVETEEDVTVMIGGDGGIPGGFAKFFNRSSIPGLGRASPTPPERPTSPSSASPTSEINSAWRSVRRPS